MTRTDLPLPREELKVFLSGLSRATGLGFTYFPAGSKVPDMIVGESPFCIQLKSSPEGDRRCRESSELLVRDVVTAGRPRFDLCHARLGLVAVPLRNEDGVDLGTVMAGHALIQGVTEEHREHVASLAGEAGFDRPEDLLGALGTMPVYTRTRLEEMGRFLGSQLLEKASARSTVEDTTEYLLEKYEELMFLYAVTESLAPESGYQKALSVILDKGAQKLDARWGIFLLAGEGSGGLELLEALGDHPFGAVSEPGDLLEPLCRPCTGPALAAVSLGGGDEEVLILPFRLRNFREGYVVFGLKRRGSVGDSGLRFALALSRQAGSVLYAVHLYQELADLLFSTLEALSSAVDAKDPYTRGHSHRVAELAVMAASGMGYNPRFLTMLKIAGQLHDFGKIGVREQILGKEGRLDVEEMEAMAAHPVVGARILGRFRPFREIVPGIRHHHERFDGGGYPDGLRGEEIPMVGRIIAVADAFDAMTTDRPYRSRFGAKEAVLELRRHAGTQFDPNIVEAFISSLERRDSG